MFAPPPLLQHQQGKPRRLSWRPRARRPRRRAGHGVHAGRGPRSCDTPSRPGAAARRQGRRGESRPQRAQLSDPTYINHLIWNGRERESCDTTGTETDGGYTEALFNWRVGSDLAADLRAEGAQVVLTRHNNDGVGPA